MISFLEVREAMQAEHERAIGIIELCAAVPSLAEGFIRAGTSVRDVKRTLATHQPAAAGQQQQQRPAGFDPAWIMRELQKTTTLQ